ncbi:TspO protein [candidate division WOR-3 bacterium RBG_13_43_14]|uniref:TspO protein n=1 Tax=candidate division WOR-3 bacterium RBG_13_43_14 TaxID=1802590 RepID=A0A1F4UF87_UNCW3|nr:MAG: TspO protein [candidate division WOR-3 bacterium RBG_13_43_14]
MKGMHMRSYIKLIISLLVCLGSGFIGSIFTTPRISTWYTTLQKPAFNPPNWLFGPVWTMLFILMGIALFIIWNKDNVPGARAAIFIFAVQLIFNILWSIVFFGLKSPIGGIFMIIILWILIVITIFFFYRQSLVAGVLLVPYLLWVSFASVLNIAIYLLNRSA